MAACTSNADCSGYNGDCRPDGTCECHPGWTGPRCGWVHWKDRSATPAFDSTSWTWGGSPLRDSDGVVHMFASEISDGCGILHYCSNSQVIHLTSASPLGPYTRHGVALAPRPPPAWDSGATHGPTVHELPDGDANGARYAIFYMGAANTWDPAGGRHPNCSVKVDPQSGDRATRRVGIATAPSLWGPWSRRSSPLFGPGSRSAGEWDWEDVSNATPIFLPNGTVILLYKGRGGRLQAMGAARASSYEGPYVRTQPARPVMSWQVEDTWGWVQPASSAGPQVLHVLSHVGNGASHAGGHAWSIDGVHWNDTTLGGTPAYTGTVRWAAGRTSVLARRERPQALLLRRADIGRGNGSTSVDGGFGGSVGVPEVVCTSAEDEVCRHDGGPGTVQCRSYTMCEAVDLG